jgi:hypothetical protein
LDWGVHTAAHPGTPIKKCEAVTGQSPAGIYQAASHQASRAIRRRFAPGSQPASERGSGSSSTNSSTAIAIALVQTGARVLVGRQCGLGLCPLLLLQLRLKAVSEARGAPGPWALGGLYQGPSSKLGPQSPEHTLQSPSPPQTAAPSSEQLPPGPGPWTWALGAGRWTAANELQQDRTTVDVGCFLHRNVGLRHFNEPYAIGY